MLRDRYFYYNGEDTPTEVTIPITKKGYNNRFLSDHNLMKDKSDRQYNAVMGKRHGIFRNPLLSEIIEYYENKIKIGGNAI